MGDKVILDKRARRVRRRWGERDQAHAMMQRRPPPATCPVCAPPLYHTARPIIPRFRRAEQRGDLSPLSTV